MEAARKRDETGPHVAGHSDSGFSTPVPTSHTERPTPIIEATEAAPPSLRPEYQGGVSAPGTRPTVEELLVCSLQGEVLHEWQCANPNGRVSFLEFLAQKARQLAQGVPVGELDRLEVNGAQGRTIAQIQADRALLIRTRLTPLDDTTVSP
jgi:hypothetical protein